MPSGRFEARVETVLSRLSEPAVQHTPEGVAEASPAGVAAVTPLPQAAAHLCGWLDKLRSWNARMDLTAARDDDELVDLMVADAALLAQWLPHGARVLDVGTGAGAPGLALAMLRADLELTLVEPLGRRATFLRLVAGALPSEMMPQVLTERAEALDGHWQVALSRATLPPQAWLERGALLAPKGEVWVLLARLDAPLLPSWSCVSELSYRWPLTGAERRALCFRPERPNV